MGYGPRRHRSSKPLPVHQQLAPSVSLWADCQRTGNRPIPASRDAPVRKRAAPLVRLAASRHREASGTLTISDVGNRHHGARKKECQNRCQPVRANPHGQPSTVVKCEGASEQCATTSHRSQGSTHVRGLTKRSSGLLATPSGGHSLRLVRPKAAELESLGGKGDLNTCNELSADI